MPSAPSFRRARRADLPAIVALLAADPLGRAREDVASPLSQAYWDAFDAIDADGNQLLAIAEDAEGGAVIGVMQITFVPGLSRKGAWRGQIEGVRVAEAARGSGLGRRFFEWAIARCRDRGCALVQLTSDATRPDAHRFYEALGFVPSHVGFKLGL